MKRAYKVYDVANGYKVAVYDNGYCCNLCDCVDGEWKDCIFSTEDEAINAMNAYNDFWKEV